MWKKLFKYIVLLCGIFIFHFSYAQFVDPREAKLYFKNKNYPEAIRVYKRLIVKDPSNTEYRHYMGLCYLRSNIDKSKSVTHLEKAVQGRNVVDVNPEWFFDLGLAYQINYEFDDAIKMFNTIKGLVASNKREKIINQINSCLSAKELIKYPVNVSFRNLGSKVNTPFPDYYPFITKNGKKLVFTSRRPSNIGGIQEFDGFYSSDVWISTKSKGFDMAKNGGIMINTSMDEQVVGLSDNGDQLFVYVDHIKKYGDIYFSEKKKGSATFQKIKKFGSNINSKSLETSASLSSDGSTLFFASKKSGGHGGLDLYMSRKLPTGEWALSQNLGPQINTKYNEDFPTLSGDGKTLYFCSEGHTSMGGYDIFKSVWNAENNSWSPPKNLGYPVNTPDDNRVISFTENGKFAYVSEFRSGGIGDLDIYEIKFNDLSNNLAVFEMYLNADDTAGSHVKEAFVEILNKDNQKIGEYMPNPKTGKYLIILPPGQYDITIDSPNYELLSKEFIVRKKDITAGVIHKEYFLTNRNN